MVIAFHAVLDLDLLGEIVLSKVILIVLSIIKHAVVVSEVINIVNSVICVFHKPILIV